MKRLVIGMFLAFSLSTSYAQFGTCSCSATIGSFSVQTPVNFSSITWTGTGCPTSGSTSYTGNLCLILDTKATLVFDKTNFTVTGNFNVQNTGTSTIFDIPSTDALHVTGNFGDPTNNTMDFVVDGTLKVDGTFYGKNSNAFSGAGSISGGSLSLGSGGTCGSGSPVTNCPIAAGSFGSCSASGNPNFCATYSVPVKLESFTSKVNGQKVELNWTTASEINFDYFSLQRSGDGKLFNEIAQIKGHGTTNEAHNYSYDDLDPLIGRSYYRLTSNDFDGYQETFKVVSVEYHGGKSFHIYSNPSDGASIKLHFNFERDADGVVTVYDNVGSVVGSYPAGESIAFTNTLKSGVYLAKYSSASFTSTQRFLVK